MFLKRFKNNLFIKKIQNYSLNYLDTPVKDKYEKLVEEHLEASFSYLQKEYTIKPRDKNAENIFYSNINQNNKLKIDLHIDFGMYFLEIGITLIVKII